MELWTIQDERIMDVIERDGIYRPLFEHTEANTGDGSGYFRTCYQWMASRLRDKDAQPWVDAYASENDGYYPPMVWTWFKRYGRNDGKVDMRSWVMSESERVVRLKLDVDESRVLLSDFEEWHIPLNMGACTNEEEDLVEKRKLEEAGLSPFDLFENGWPCQKDENPIMFAFEQARIATWDEVLVKSPDDVKNGTSFFGTPYDRREVQGVMWELRADDIKSVERFVTRSDKITREKENALIARRIEKMRAKMEDAK